MANVLLSENADLSRLHIERVLLRAVDLASTNGDERVRLLTWELKHVGVWSPDDEIELFGEFVYGYAHSVVSGGRRPNPESVVVALQEQNLFTSPAFDRWHRDSSKEYPILSSYVETLDYLRLLLLQHISRYW